MSTKKQSLGSRFYGILIPAASGKTELAKRIHGRGSGKKDLAFIDIDSLLKAEPGATSVDLFPKAKALLAQKYKEYPKHKIVLISSNTLLVKYLKIDKEHQAVFVPTTSFFLKLLTNRGLFRARVSDNYFSRPVEQQGNVDEKQEPRARAYSIGKESGTTQTFNKPTREELPKVFEEEVKAVSTSRDALNSIKNDKYSSFDELVDLVSKFLLK